MKQISDKSLVKLYNNLAKKYNVKNWFRVGAPIKYDQYNNIYSVQMNKSLEEMFKLAQNKYICIFEGRMKYDGSDIGAFIIDDSQFKQFIKPQPILKP